MSVPVDPVLPLLIEDPIVSGTFVYGISVPLTPLNTAITLAGNGESVAHNL